MSASPPPVGEPELGPVELTIARKDEGILSKRIALDADGEMKADGSACRMGRGTLRRHVLDAVDPLGSLAGLIDEMPSNECLILGQLSPEVPDEVACFSAAKLAKARRRDPACISRTQAYIKLPEGSPGLLLLDFDRKGMTDAVRKRIEELGGTPSKVLRQICPWLEGVGMVKRRSTSSGITNAETGNKYPGSGGAHIYLVVEDATKIPEVLRTIHDHCLLAGLAWPFVDSAGRVHVRTIVDATVASPERLVFEGQPIVEVPLQQDAERRRCQVDQGGALRSADVKWLDDDERARVDNIKAELIESAGPKAQKRRAAWDKSWMERQKKEGRTEAEARSSLERVRRGVLDDNFPLMLDGGSEVTVRELLLDRELYDGLTMADPLEGPEYGLCKARAYLGQSVPIINSFAHGGIVYRLRFSRSTVEQAIDTGEVTDEAMRKELLQMLALAEVDSVSTDQLLRKLADKAGVGIRAVRRVFDVVRLEMREQERQWARARRQSKVDHGGRREIPVPYADAELDGVVVEIEAAILDRDTAFPPMRDLSGHLMVAREQRWPLLHPLRADPDAPEVEPAPSWGLVTLDRFTAAEEIERHIEITKEVKDDVVSVQLPGIFVKAMQRRLSSALPTAGSIVEHPIMLADGSLPQQRGLDTPSGLIFCFPDDLIQEVESAPDPSQADAQAALEVLRNELFADVLFASESDFAKAVVLLLTNLERRLLDHAPGWIITAPTRGVGKTTLLDIVSAVVLGRTMNAVSWPHRDEEELRKLLLTLLANGHELIAFDNLLRGAAIKSSTLAEVLTASVFTGRRLGYTEEITVRTNCTIVLTGNAISASGDLCSRLIPIELRADTTMPEARATSRIDPVGWALANRSRMLQALFTILRWHLLTRTKTSKTRFRDWHGAVAAAVGRLLDIDWDQQLRVAEGGEGDEEAGWRCLVQALHDGFGLEAFKVADVVEQVWNGSVDETDGSDGDPWPTRVKDAVEQLRPGSAKDLRSGLGYVLRDHGNRPAEIEIGNRVTMATVTRHAPTGDEHRSRKSARWQVSVVGAEG